eukprot:m.389606 g.389606  ORF g.389606 m.389606 type:complete len:59 (+) comp21052_c0_seq14:268-444(+)
MVSRVTSTAKWCVGHESSADKREHTRIGVYFGACDDVRFRFEFPSVPPAHQIELHRVF